MCFGTQQGNQDATIALAKTPQTRLPRIAEASGECASGPAERPRASGGLGGRGAKLAKFPHDDKAVSRDLRFEYTSAMSIGEFLLENFAGDLESVLSKLAENSARTHPE